MDTEKVYTTSLRLYKSRPVHHQAYRYLKEYNKDIFKTKDDFIAEAIVYFAKYLQQEEDVQQMKLLNTLLENQKEQFCKIVKEAVSKAQEEAFEKLLGRIHPGAIVLLHSTSSTNAQILDELLTRWEAKGYHFASLGSLI